MSAEQPREIVDGCYRFFEFDDGHASMADGAGWVSALFVSLAAAKSWRGYVDDAEAEFRRLNGGKSQGKNFVPERKR